jgi:hypothetical protein
MGSIIFLYDLSYSYDQVGNRTEKADHLTGATTTYIYDVEDREEYGSNVTGQVRTVLPHFW